MDRIHQQPPQPTPAKHAPRDCNLCGILRHPAQAANGRALTKRLNARPFPQQATA
ncbi:hypothetical protein [Streptomyces sp. NPDC004324]